MKITALEEYGLRCVLRLAMNPGGGALTVAEIAQNEGLTVPYVGKLMSLLRQNGIVDSVRGRGGGYALSRPAAEITVEEVVNALGDPLFSADYCESHPGTLDVCSHQGNCGIRSVWQVLGDMIHKVLRATTLADLCQQEERLASRIKTSIEPQLLRIGASLGPEAIGAAAASVTAAPAHGRPDQGGFGRSGGGSHE